MAFTGMVGRMLAQTMLRSRMAKNASNVSVNNAGGYRGAFQSSGKYLFVAHPNCCPKCTQMNGTLWNTPDVAFISHPNCMCATIEAPAGLSPSELMDWTKSPVGVMRFGFNYGQSLKPVQLSHVNRDKVFAQWQNRMDPREIALHPRRQVRAKVSQAQIDAIRARVESGELGPGQNLTGRVQGFVKAARTRKKQQKELESLAKSMNIRTVAPSKRTGPLELPKLKKGKTWNPNSGNSANAKKNAQKNYTRYHGNTAVMPRKSGGDATAMPRQNVKYTGSLREVAKALGITGRLLARQKYADRRKKKKKREQER